MTADDRIVPLDATLEQLLTVTRKVVLETTADVAHQQEVIHPLGVRAGPSGLGPTLQHVLDSLNEIRAGQVALAEVLEVLALLLQGGPAALLEAQSPDLRTTTEREADDQAAKSRQRLHFIPEPDDQTTRAR